MKIIDERACERLTLGDEVLQWNNFNLRGKSFQEVADIIAMSRDDAQVELVVARDLNASATTAMNIGKTGMMATTMPVTHGIGAPVSPGPGNLTPLASRRYAAQTQWRQKHEAIMPQQPHHKGEYLILHVRPLIYFFSHFSLFSFLILF